MDTSAPLARVRSNRAMISAVRHGSDCMQETGGEDPKEGSPRPTPRLRTIVTENNNTRDTNDEEPSSSTVVKQEEKRIDQSPTMHLSKVSSSSSSFPRATSPVETIVSLPSPRRPNKVRKLDDDQDGSSNNNSTQLIWPQRVSAQQQQPKLLRKRTTRRRTETSYDEDTTTYLKRVFFEVYGQGRKLSKHERRRIEQDTGLMSRKITYWFSNQKRRFSAELKAFQRLSRQGCIKTYDEFLIWCEENYVPELGSMPQHQFDDDEIEEDDNDNNPSSSQSQSTLSPTQQPSTLTTSSSSH
ncbi:hypothetical protein K492DRAFT_170634 [Lichtheimia hyalospora FSU 10163]|nr:hypothetical protein K492DRAFT_170634 [Lichtheimia hyalospora FSU 10163]